MMTHEAPEGRSDASRPGPHRLFPIAGITAGRSGHRRLLPIAGITAAIVAVVGHFGGGALVMHVVLPALLAYLGFGGTTANLGGALGIGIVAAVAIKLLVVFGVFGGALGARHWLRRR